MNELNRQGTVPRNSDDDDSDYNLNYVASTGECTGLIPTPPLTDEEADSYTDLFHIPKPQGGNRESSHKSGARRAKRK
jgi:hypothetical protein